MFIHLLVSKGWFDEMIDDYFSIAVGPDYSDVKMTVWIERLEEMGIEFPDGKPVFKVLNELLINRYGDNRQWN
jgi:hypothetical protein